MSELVKAESVTLSVPGEAEVGNAEEQPAEEYPGVRCADGARWLVVDFVSTASRLIERPRGPKNHRTLDRCLENLCTKVAPAVRHRDRRACRGGIRKEFSDRLLPSGKTVADTFDPSFDGINRVKPLVKSPDTFDPFLRFFPLASPRSVFQHRDAISELELQRLITVVDNARKCWVPANFSVKNFKTWTLKTLSFGNKKTITPQPINPCMHLLIRSCSRQRNNSVYNVCIFPS